MAFPVKEPWATPGRQFLKHNQVAALQSPIQRARVKKQVKFVTKVNDQIYGLGETHRDPLTPVSVANFGNFPGRKYRKDVGKRNGENNNYTESYGSSRAVYNFSKRAMLTAFDRNDTAQNQNLVNSEFVYKSFLGPPSEKIEMYTHDFAPKPTSAVSRTSPMPNDGSSGTSTDSGRSRYRARQTASTKVVHVGPKTLPVDKKKGRGVNGFFPPVKLRDMNSETKRFRSEYLVRVGYGQKSQFFFPCKFVLN